MMDNLAPPHNRLRASSTNIRPALTLTTCGSRKRSNSSLDMSLSSPTSSHTPPRVNTPAPEKSSPSLSLDIPTTSEKQPSESMFSLLVSRCFQLLHSAHVEAILPTTPSSPRLSRASTSSDDTILPISSPTQAYFADSPLEKHPVKSRSRWLYAPSAHAPVFFVILLLPISAALVLFCISTLPITMAWPRNLTDLAQLGRELHGYSQSGPGPMAHVIGVMAVTAVWKHAWSIPGSVIWNVLAGALFSPAYATLLLTTLTTVGSVFASLLAAPLAPFLVSVFPRALALTRSALEGGNSQDDPSTKSKNTSPAWVRLSILRLIGIIPWSGINIACGVCGVSLADCFLGAFIGTLPWTAVTCQIGDILQTVASTPSPTPQTVQSVLASPEIIFKLVFLSFLSLAPILGRDYLRLWISSSAHPAPDVSREVIMEMAGERESRWGWVTEWRAKIRLPSRARAQEAVKKELEVLIREKNESLPL